MPYVLCKTHVPVRYARVCASAFTRVGFRFAHMRALIYSICNVYYRQMRAYALYGIQLR